MKICYMTDDRSQYRQGNYYVSYLKGFQDKFETKVNALIKEDFSLYDLVVIGHGAQDKLISGEYNTLVDILHKTKVPILIFSKNDYKNINSKNILSKNIGATMTITHSKMALYDLVGNTEWIPFGVSKEFKFTDNFRGIDIGGRANKNIRHIGDERNNFFNVISKLKDYSRDVKLSDNGEDFKHGKEYIDWLTNCTFILNTASAIGTVGSRFLEAMACGCVNMCPYNNYEGLLKPDIHYLCVDIKNPLEIKHKIEMFVNDSNLRNTIYTNQATLVEENLIENQIDKIINKMGI